MCQLSERDHFSKLLIEAQKEYKQKIIGSKITINVFADQFYSNHRNISAITPEVLNRHESALNLMNILLKERKDIVKRYFAKRQINEADIDEIMQMLQTGSYSDSGIIYDESIPDQIKHTIYDSEWRIITNCVNEANLFTQEVSIEQIKSLFMCKPTEQLYTSNLETLCYFFQKLHVADYIKKWQTKLAKSNAIISASTMRPITAHNMSSILSRHRSNGREVINQVVIDNLIHQLDINHNKESMSTKVL